MLNIAININQAIICNGPKGFEEDGWIAQFRNKIIILLLKSKCLYENIQSKFESLKSDWDIKILKECSQFGATLHVKILRNYLATLSFIGLFCMFSCKGKVAKDIDQNRIDSIMKDSIAKAINIAQHTKQDSMKVIKTKNILDSNAKLKIDKSKAKQHDIASVKLKNSYVFDYPMVKVQGGTFDMGSDKNINESPVHSITLNSFYIGTYEVTQKLWVQIIGNNPSNFRGYDLPVEQISWDDIVIFIITLNQLTGQNYRLPYAAEWEYAAGGGEQNRTSWSGTNDENSLSDYAWYNPNCNNKTHPVGTKKPNSLGIYDMSGNVWEWCQDWYDIKYYSTSESKNPHGPLSGSSRVIRGGSWRNEAPLCRIRNRARDFPKTGDYSIGFRLVRSE